MFGLVATCRRLASAPGDATTWCVAGPRDESAVAVAQWRCRWRWRWRCFTIHVLMDTSTLLVFSSRRVRISPRERSKAARLPCSALSPPKSSPAALHQTRHQRQEEQRCGVSARHRGAGITPPLVFCNPLLQQTLADVQGGVRRLTLPCASPRSITTVSV